MGKGDWFQEALAMLSRLVSFSGGDDCSSGRSDSLDDEEFGSGSIGDAVRSIKGKLWLVDEMGNRFLLS